MQRRGTAMAINEAAVRGRQKQYEDTVIDFVKNQKGHFLAVTDDQAFLSVLRTVLTKDLALTSPDLLNWIPEPSQLLKEFRKADEASPNIVVFMERMIHGQDLTFLVRQLKLAYPKVYIVVVTVEIEQARLMYLHEVGADNFITKPVSANTIIEKLAFTLKPQSKLGSGAAGAGTQAGQRRWLYCAGRRRKAAGQHAGREGSIYRSQRQRRSVP